MSPSARSIIALMKAVALLSLAAPAGHGLAALRPGFHSGGGAQTCASKPIISGFVPDAFYRPANNVVETFKGTNFNTIATTIAWSVAEQRQGAVNLDRYYPALDALASSGYCLIVILDTSGRKMDVLPPDMRGKSIGPIPEFSIPPWVSGASMPRRQIDFYNGPTNALDFNDPKALQLAADFYRKVIPLLRGRYGPHITAIAPCVTDECEIKYAQRGFKWQSYGEIDQSAFRGYLRSKGLPPAKLPVLDYANSLGRGRPRVQPDYPAMQDFREDSIRNYACALSDIIKTFGFSRMGYFGQPFAFTDGIYATGVIEKTINCFDIVSIDYNFYNGYAVEDKIYTPAFITKYAIDLGYKKVITGLYMERFRDPATAAVGPHGFDVLRSAIAELRPSAAYAGLEIGNLSGHEWLKPTYLKDEVRRFTSPRHSPARPAKTIGLYASMANSYLWQGDWSNGRQVNQDDLVQTYAHLMAKPNYQVRIVSDHQLAANPQALNAYDLIILPHLTAPPPAGREALRKFILAGGKTLSDLGLDEYRPSGEPQKDSLQALLGIRAARPVKGHILVHTGWTLHVLPRQNQYVNGFILAPRQGYAVQYPGLGPGGGLVVKGQESVVFGFMPLLVQGKAAPWAIGIFDDSVKNLVERPTRSTRPSLQN